MSKHVVEGSGKTSHIHMCKLYEMMSLTCDSLSTP